MTIISFDRLKSFINPTELLRSLGFNISWENDDEIRAPCLIHGGDNRTAFCFRKEIGRFYCFSHGCEFGLSGNLDNDAISLVMKVNKCSFSEAVDYLCYLVGVDKQTFSIVEEEADRIKKEKGKEFFINTINKNKELPELPEDLVKVYISRGHHYFSSIGIPEEIIEKYELGSMVDFFGVERGTIPIRDEHGRLVSISGRRIDGDKEPRYRLVQNFKKSRVLYNLNNALKIRDRFNKIIIIVEGFKALWSVFSCGFPNVVAIMGKKISKDQVNLLVKSGFFYSLLLLDGDEAGREGVKTAEKRLAGKLDNTTIYLPDGLCPDDVSHKELFDLISVYFLSVGGKNGR